jgi:M6 family metalloprotease-like protein
MRVRLLIVLWVLLACASTYAVPAYSGAELCTQSDGTRLLVYLHGDEHFHYHATDDGCPIAQGTDSSYFYLSASAGQWLLTDVLAHNVADRSPAEVAFLAACRDSVQAFLSEIAAHAHLPQWGIYNITSQPGIYNTPSQPGGENSTSQPDLLPQPGIYNTTSQQNLSPRQRSAAQVSLKEIDPTKFIGSRRGLVLLVNFSDLAMQGDDPNADFNRQINEIGYHENNHVGSVHDYFRDQSYGLFDLQFDVVGPLTLSRSVTYYGENNTMLNKTDIHSREMVAEACALADPFVDFSAYDWDGDGDVEQIFIIYAGWGESSGAPTYTIWPHRGTITTDTLTFDGVTVRAYACSCELAHSSGAVRNGIGVICHEFSHCLNLPDFYDVNYNGGIGMQQWDLMAAGGYNGPDGIGEVPSGYTAYERAALGWLQLTELTDTTHVRGMAPLDSLPEAYVIRNDGANNEYFTLENRQSSRWFSYVGNHTDLHGLLITHVNYNTNIWQSNIVNTNVSRQRMSFVPADGDYGYSYTTADGAKRYAPREADLRGDLFPGSAGVTDFTPLSHTAVGGVWLNASAAGSTALSHPLLNIREHGGLISFDYVSSLPVPVPQSLAVQQTDSAAVVVRWQLPAAADSCVVELQEVRSIDDSGSDLSGLIGLIKPLDSRTATVVGADSCTFSALTAAIYRCRVKAVIDDLSSEWTPYDTINLDAAFTSVARCWADEQPRFVRVYNLQGVEVMSGTDLRPADLLPGTYLWVEGKRRVLLHKNY